MAGWLVGSVGCEREKEREEEGVRCSRGCKEGTKREEKDAERR